MGDDHLLNRQNLKTHNLTRFLERRKYSCILLLLISGLIEFGCVYIYTCSSNCWTDQSKNAKQEFVIIHADTDQRFYKC